MLTVPEAARRVERDPETVRRWIRSGKLASQRVGTQHLIDEADLEAVTAFPETLPVPEAWETPVAGERVDWVALLHESRRGR